MLSTKAAIELLGDARYKIFDALVETDGFAFIAVGRPESAGCYCKINTYLKEVISILSNEFDYVVIDSTLGKSGNYFDILKDLYTLSQRASKGVIVHGGTDIAKSRLNQMSNINIALDPNQIKNFIEWKKRTNKRLQNDIFKG